MPKTAPNTFPRGQAAYDRAEVHDALLDLHSLILMDAVIAACAIVAHADGDVAPAERARATSVMRGDPLLSMFPRSEVRAAFDAHASAFNDDPAEAIEAALRMIMPLAGRRHDARVVLGACLLITTADGRIDRRELDAIGLVREALDLSAQGAAQDSAQDAA